MSLSEKIYVSELINWFVIEFFKKISFINERKDSFTLSNKKLLKKIDIKPLKVEFKKFCKSIFK